MIQAPSRTSDRTEQPLIRAELWVDNTSGQVCRVFPVNNAFHVIYPNGLAITLSKYFFSQGYSPAEIPVG